MAKVIRMPDGSAAKRAKPLRAMLRSFTVQSKAGFLRIDPGARHALNIRAAQHRPMIELFYFDAGGGHRSASTALLQVITQSYPQWQVTLVNLQELLQDIDPVHRLSKFQSQDVYNAMLKRGWTGATTVILRALQQGIRALSPLMEMQLRRHWQQSKPDLVVSLIPNFNGVMFRALRDVLPTVPYITVMTDLADSPPRFWQEAQDQYLVCGTEKAMRQARAIGYRPNRIFRVSGMVLKPQFYQSVDPCAVLTRQAIGLNDARPVALIMFGGYSADTALQIVHTLRDDHPSVQTIVMCGHNEALRRKLQGIDGCHAVGFTSDVPSYLRLADFFIGKPGPGSISEALHIGLPVIVERTRKTMTQERYNTVWIEEQKIGIVVTGFDKISSAVEKMLRRNVLARFRANAARLDNQALFEIPRIFDQILADHSAAAHAVAVSAAIRPRVEAG
ncbi:MAG: galactosyldiacylglycerol synthase [Hydrocarboniphaga sp.]|uniref:MGDG synthase family glycosyltransferase n=1 Tax=Hydrocarboniphaga sp. TaxID=2033016 RepID=UPI002604E718|nr:glycosyltransferase [Hydrocarboniphaga sp.]MDB5970872.1 galactosyldiacylglycerol synthase [Hydrocarboniphaga sp.]